MDKTRMVSNPSGTEFTRMYDTTAIYEQYNDTECVGQPDYCNMTREEYIEMLYDYIYPQPYEWVLIVIHAIVFLIGLIGNAMVCIAVFRNHSMRTVTNYFIVNLAVADFVMILICLPPTVLWDVTETWFFGDAMCRIVQYFQSVSVTVSVLTLAFISVDRWYAICFPLKFKSTTGRAKTAILAIWFISLLFNVPDLVVLQVQKKKELRFDMQFFMQCTPTWSDESELKWSVAKALFLYTLPLFLMMIAYCQIVRVLWRSDHIPGHSETYRPCTPRHQPKLLCTSQNNSKNCLATGRRAAASAHGNALREGQLRSRREAAKMLFAVVAMFAVCYFPLHLISVLRVAVSVQQTDVMSCIALISHVMRYANSAVKPLIYNFMSDKFRRKFYRTYFKCFCCRLAPPSPKRSSPSLSPVGSSRTRSAGRRDPCASYRLADLAPAERGARDFRAQNTSFIEPANWSRRVPIQQESVESTMRFTLMDTRRDCRLNTDSFCNVHRAIIHEDPAESSSRSTPQADARRYSGLNTDPFYYVNRDMETNIANSTDSIVCKPYYDCFKGSPERIRVMEKRHSDTHADYRGRDSEFDAKDESENEFHCKPYSGTEKP